MDVYIYTCGCVYIYTHTYNITYILPNDERKCQIQGYGGIGQATVGLVGRAHVLYIPLLPCQQKVVEIPVTVKSNRRHATSVGNPVGSRIASRRNRPFDNSMRCLGVKI